MNTIIESLHYRRNFYFMLRRMILDHGTARAKRRFYWQMALLTYNCCFMAPLLTMMVSDYKFEWWRLEPLSYYFYLNRDQYDYYLISIASLFHLFVSYMHYNYYRVPAHSKTFQWYYQLVVGLQDWYYQCAIKDQKKLNRIYNRKYLQIYENIRSSKYSWIIPNVLVKNHSKIQAKLQINLQLENVDKRRFFSVRDSMLTKMFNQLKAKILRLLIISDMVTYVCLVMFAIVCTLVNLALYPTIFVPFPWYYLPWVVFLAFATSLNLQQLLQSAFFFTQLVLVSNISMPGYLKELTRKIVKIVSKFKHRQLRVRHARLVHQFLVDHNRICYKIISGNREMFANVCFAFLLADIPINIFLISRLVFVQMNVLSRLVVWIMFIGQSTVFYLTLAPMAYGCKTYHSVEKIIPAVQRLMMGHRWALLKLKYDDLFMRLLIGQKYGTRIGPLREITNWALCELVMLYVGYLLMIFSQEIESRMNQNKT